MGQERHLPPSLPPSSLPPSSPLSLLRLPPSVRTVRCDLLVAVRAGGSRCAVAVTTGTITARHPYGLQTTKTTQGVAQVRKRRSELSTDHSRGCGEKDLARGAASDGALAFWYGPKRRQRARNSSDVSYGQMPAHNERVGLGGRAGLKLAAPVSNHT